ncbi:MAG: GAF domain-containing protein, partial [Brevibacterium sp.]|nr:GAF domain-containing protein [Brevibacterium sp.]
MDVKAKESRALKAATRRLFVEAVDSLHRCGTGDVVFGGMVEDDEVAVEAVAGGGKGRLSSLIVSTGRGLGGRALTEGTPQLTKDYGIDPFITHHYDEEVLGEGIQVLIAVPTLRGGDVTGMIYCGHRKNYNAAAPKTSGLVKRVRQLSVDLGRLGQPRPPEEPAEPERMYSDLESSSREALRRTYAELRSIRSGVDENEMRQRLTLVENRLADILSGHNPVLFPNPTPTVSLSPRETD